MRISAGRGLPFQIERDLQLIEPRDSLIERERVLLGVNLGNEVVLAHVEPRALDVVLGGRDLRLVLGLEGRLLGALLGDLALEVDHLGAAVERVTFLLLRVELDEQVAWLDACAGGHETNDEERKQRALEPRDDDGPRTHRFDGARQTNRVRRLGWRGRRGRGLCLVIGGTCAATRDTAAKRSKQRREDQDAPARRH